MHRQTLLRNAVAAGTQTLLQMAVLVVVYKFVVSRLGIEQVGVWAVVLASASVTRITELGLAGSVTKYVASYRASSDDAAASVIVQTAALTVGAVLGLILLVAYPALLWLMPYLLPAGAQSDGAAVLPYALGSMWLSAVSAVWLSGLDGCLRTDVRAALMIAATLLFLVLVLATVPSYGLVGLAIAQLGQGAALTLAGWMVLKYVLRPLPFLPIAWDQRRFREMLGYGVNVQVMSIVMLLFEPTAKVLFARYGGLSATGYFELAQQFVVRIRGLVVESNRVIVPVLARLEEFGHDARRLYVTNVHLLLFFLTPLFALLAATMPAVSEWWLGRYESDFVLMGVCLTVGWYLNSVTAPAYFAYLGYGRLRWLTVSHVLLGVSNLVLGAALGPAFGWPGVLAAFVGSLVLGSSIPVWTFNREQQLRLRDLVSSYDVWALLISSAAATIAIAGYPAAARAGFGVWSRLLILLATTVVIAAVMWRHPLMTQVVAAVRRGASGSDPR